MPLVSKSMPCRQQPFETASSPAWKANRRDRRRPHGPHSPTRDRTVRPRQGLRVPNLGESRKGSVGRFRELREDGCLQCHPAASADIGISLAGRPLRNAIYLKTSGELLRLTGRLDKGGKAVIPGLRAHAGSPNDSLRPDGRGVQWNT